MKPILQVFLILSSVSVLLRAQDGEAVPKRSLVQWETRQLLSEFYTEGASTGDLNRDGHLDVVSGPFAWWGPAFSERVEIYSAKRFDPKVYSDNFFSFVHDINGDEWPDVLVIGFPGQASRWYENPRGEQGHWAAHVAMAQTDNESPAFTDITGDGRPEIVCSVNGTLGYAVPNSDAPTEPFQWHAISPAQAVGGRFTHGLGVGDVNGDGRMDLLEKERWWEQPASLQGDPMWKSHRFKLGTPGGAQMYAYDVDGDGDQDLLTSLAAHAYGLAWYEQIEGEGGKRQLEERLIMGDDPLQNPYGLAFSQMHAIALRDIDGDGLKDLITGKRYWAHGGKDPGGNDPAVLYWFRTVRDGAGGVDFVPYQIHEHSGVGTEVEVADVNADGLLDIVIGNKKGVWLHVQKRVEVDEESWKEAQPLKAFIDGIKPMTEYAAGYPADEAAKAMTLPEGFQATLLAGEPELRQPVTFCFDDRGRLWVAEAHNYPFPAKEGEAGKDQILIFEDTDHDGSFETRKVFAEGLSLVSGMEVGFGGVWVGAAPYFLFIPDRDGDDVPDGEPEILLDGWGLHDTHETLNSFSWGPDGWLYGLQGVFTHSWVGKPGTPKEDRDFLNCAVWRYHPVRHEFEIFSTGTSNPWGLDFDEYGQAFISACVIPHLWHMIQGAYYERQGGQHQREHLYELLGTIARHRHFAGNVAEHAHWGHTPRADIIGGETFARGGGHAHCGLTIYRGDAFPKSYDGALLMFNLHGHRINWDRVRPSVSGSNYVGEWAPDFLFANDHWFVGTHLDYGPDGALYFSDWHDDTTCHRQSDLEWDRTNGRLFRVHHGEYTPVQVNLGEALDEQLVACQLHNNEWYARVARRVLQERVQERAIGSEAVDALWGLAMAHREVPVRLRALWTLHGIGEAGDRLPSLLESHHPEQVRAWTVRLLGEQPDQLGDELVGQLLELAASDRSALVRRHLASLLQRLPSSRAWPLVEALARRAEDATDDVNPLILWYGLEPLVVEDPGRGLALAKETAIPKLRSFILRRVAAIPGGYDKVLAVIDDAGTAAIVVRALAQQLDNETKATMPESWPRIYDLLIVDAKPDLKRDLMGLAGKFGDERVFPAFREWLGSQNQSEDLRRVALNALMDSEDDGVLQVLMGLVPSKEDPLREEVIHALGRFDKVEARALLLEYYTSFSTSERQAAIGALTRYPAAAHSLLLAIGEGMVPRGDLPVVSARQIRQFGLPRLDEALTQHWGAFSESAGDKAEAMEKWKAALGREVLAKANLSNGRRVYNQTCYACHTLFGQGVPIGPDITGANRADLAYVLENILDPSSVVPLDYQLSVFTLKDGGVASGMVRQESETAFTVALPGGTETRVAKEAIKDRQTLPQSFMPEGLLDALSAEDARDLIGYLQSEKQVRLAEEGEVLLEGERLEVLEKTGSTTNQGMGSFSEDRWSGDTQLWWTGARPGDRLVLGFELPEAGKYRLAGVFTKAVDYGKLRLALNGQEDILVPEIDCYEAGRVVTTGEVALGERELTAGQHRLVVDVLGKHPEAAEGYMFGLDYILLVPVKE